MEKLLSSADIYLPADRSASAMQRYAVIACDQYTSSPGYWNSVSNAAEGGASTLDLVLPEIYLKDAEKRTADIDRAMKDYLENGKLQLFADSYIYVERTLPDGRIRRGIVGKTDLEAYDYRKGSTPPVRATEGTVLERIPPRVKIRSEAMLELPHIMLLVNDPGNSLIGYFSERKESMPLLYDFELMLGGGHIKGYRAEKSIYEGFDRLFSVYCEKSGGFPVAVGDGNHSLAAAKALYEEEKKKLGSEALSSPLRYALTETVNLFDTALDFEPIHRVLFGASEAGILTFARKYSKGKKYSFGYVTGGTERAIEISSELLLPDIGILQSFLDDYTAQNSGTSVDYIHGEEELIRLSAGGAIGFYGSSVSKSELFPYVRKFGVLPRKTFSMGEAKSKRYYIEARKIR